MDESLEEQVCNYEKEQQEDGQIVFYGPSYFARWKPDWGFKPMREVLLGKSGKPCVVNRGFGSSCSEHQLYYYHRMIKPLKPKVLVYECMANGEFYGYTIEEIWELAQRVLCYARTDFPDITIYLCSAHFSPKYTCEQINNAIEFNKWLKRYVDETPNCHYIDAWSCEPLRNPNIFVEDMVHFNEEGYKLYGEFFKKELKGELDLY